MIFSVPFRWEEVRVSGMFQEVHAERPPVKAHQNPPEQKRWGGTYHHHHRWDGGGGGRGAGLAEDRHCGVALAGFEPGHAHHFKQFRGGVRVVFPPKMIGWKHHDIVCRFVYRLVCLCSSFFFYWRWTAVWAHSIFHMEI